MPCINITIKGQVSSNCASPFTALRRAQITSTLFLPQLKRQDVNVIMRKQHTRSSWGHCKATSLYSLKTSVSQLRKCLRLKEAQETCHLHAAVIWDWLLHPKKIAVRDISETASDVWLQPVD